MTSENGMVESGVKEMQKVIKHEKDLGKKGEFMYNTEFFKLLALCNTVVCE
jgi:hypothetical protein